MSPTSPIILSPSFPSSTSHQPGLRSNNIINLSKIVYHVLYPTLKTLTGFLHKMSISSWFSFTPSYMSRHMKIYLLILLILTDEKTEVQRLNYFCTQLASEKSIIETEV